MLKLTNNLLMGAGPVNVSPNVAEAAGSVINHLGNEMKHLILSLRKNLAEIAKTKSGHIYCVAGSSSAAMEAVVANLITEKSRVLVVGTNGEFNKRWIELLDLHAFSFTVLEPEERKSVSLEMVEDELKSKEFDICLMTHGETSNGTKLGDIKNICKALRKKNIISVVDAVSTLGALEFNMDEWGVDALVSGSQKALGSITGLGVFIFSDKAYDLAMKTKSIRWLYDFAKIVKFWDQGGYHYTAPGGLLLALNEATSNICSYGVDSWIAEHESASAKFIERLESSGFKLWADSGHILNSVIAIETEGRNPANVVEHIKLNHGIEISGSFGLPVVRIGQMNLQTLPENQQRVLEALKDAYQKVKI
jgi:alanine-glyoxylate transaminase/serine-glyoxylate transaminase/serine-pyruvate transaminase